MTIVWSLISVQGFHNGCKFCCGPQQCSQVQMLGTSQWWAELVVCTHLAAGPTAGFCVVTGAIYRHICNGKGQGQQQRPGSTMGILLVSGVLDVGMHPCGFRVLPWAHAQRWANDSVWNGSVQMCSCRGSCKQAQQRSPLTGDRARAGPTTSCGNSGYQHALL